MVRILSPGSTIDNNDRAKVVFPVEDPALADHIRGVVLPAYLRDTDGKVGSAYGARTTPHMFVIGGDGRVLYQGAIDDRPSARPASLAGANNYVRAALADIAAGRPVAVAETTPYGCSVKYA